MVETTPNGASGLQGLTGIVFSPAHGAAHDGLIPHGFRQNLRRLTVGLKAAEHRVLAIVDYDGGTIPAVL